MGTNQKISTYAERDNRDSSDTRPLISVVIPGYNEAAIVEKNLSAVCRYLRGLEDKYRWELIFVDDGSSDGTGDLAEVFSRKSENIRVIRHPVNLRLGQALRTGFDHCRGDYVVTMDLDLSYSPDHIEKMLSAIRQTGAQVVMASPYTRGGKTSNVPFLRRVLSKWANRFLSAASHHGKFSTLTGMVRTYDAKFLKLLNLKAMDVDINPEIIYKGMILRARILEIPAHLDWSGQKKEGKKRSSSIKIVKAIASCLISGFIFRPFMLFILPGLALLLLSFYPIIWAFIHTFNHYHRLSLSVSADRVDYLFSDAVAAAFQQSPHSFLVGGFTLMLSIQLISLGVLALQSKRYYEDLFHLGSSIYKDNQEGGAERILS